MTSYVCCVLPYCGLFKIYLEVTTWLKFVKSPFYMGFSYDVIHLSDKRTTLSFKALCTIIIFPVVWITPSKRNKEFSNSSTHKDGLQCGLEDVCSKIRKSINCRLLPYSKSLPKAEYYKFSHWFWIEFLN